MREIKFRAWDKEKSVMWNRLSDIGWKRRESWGEDGLSGAIVIRDDGITDFRQIERIELMQFTGLKDRHGKECFEGDTVKFLTHDGGGVVTYQAPEWVVLGEKGQIYSLRGYDYEITGNQYEGKTR